VDLEQMAVLVVMGAVVVTVLAWLAFRVRREALRRRQVVNVRHRLDPRPTVAELRARCGAERLPRYPRASPPATRVSTGKHVGGAA
jgi:hypothetical protein